MLLRTPPKDAHEHPSVYPQTTHRVVRSRPGVAQTSPLLTNGAFRLYVYACVRADRRTGCLRATVDELGRAMTKAPTADAMNLDELEARAVCRVIKKRGSKPVLQIRHGFWPYKRQQPPGRSLSEAEFVQKIPSLFTSSACVQTIFSAADVKGAAGLHRRGVSLEQVTRAILLGCARRYVSTINTGVRTPITSLQYFSHIVEEVSESAIPSPASGDGPWH